MPFLIMIRIKKTIACAVIWLLPAIGAHAQQKSKDTLLALHEFAKLGELYKHPPVRLSIHLQNTAVPVTAASDTMQADMDLYYGKGDFYMQSEGLEEIVNDSMVIMINSQTKQIVLYPNNQQVMKKIEKTVSMFIPDSTIEALSNQYGSMITDEGENKKRIELKSRELVYGTTLLKESVTVFYHSSSHEPIEFNRTKVRLVPLDSTVYSSLQKDEQYKGQLVSASAVNGNLFFLAKALTTKCIFKKIDYAVKNAPVGEGDRIVKSGNGDYIPAKGFEEYVLSKQF